MGRYPPLQPDKARLLAALVLRCRDEVGATHLVLPTSDPCRDLGICDEDLDDVQIGAAADYELRPPSAGMPWDGPERPSTIDDLASWLAADARLLNTCAEKLDPGSSPG